MMNGALTCFLCGYDGTNWSPDVSPLCSWCPECGVIAHCSELCQEVHLCGGKHRGDWRPTMDNDEGRALEPHHRCHPFRVAWDKVKGRHLVATRDIKQLEIVLKDDPAVEAPHSRPSCLVCLRKLDSKNLKNDICSGCRLPMCSPQCCNYHPDLPECSVIGSILEDDPDYSVSEESLDKPSIIYAAVGTIRFLDLLDKNEKNGEEKGPLLTRPSWLLRFMDHMEDLESDAEVGPVLKQLTTFLEKTHWDPALIKRAYGIMRINAFGFSTEPGGEGRALYPILSLLSHCCQPNIQHMQNTRGGASLIAQRDIKKGEELTLSYINIFQGALARREALRMQWYFDCICHRCQDPTEGGTKATAILCPTCKSEMLPKNHLDENSDWICESGFHSLTMNEVQAIEKTFVAKWLTVDQEDIDAIERFLAIAEKDVLSKNHHFVMKAKSHLILLYSLKEEKTRVILSRRLALCKEIIAYLSKIDPGKTKKMGVFLLEYNKPRLELAKLDKDEEKISRMEFLREVKEGAKLEAMAKDMLGRYTTVSVRALMQMVADFSSRSSEEKKNEIEDGLSNEISKSTDEL